MDVTPTKLTRPPKRSFRLPGSKSVTLRDFVLAALSDGPCVVSSYGACDDTERMMDSLQRLGVRVEKHGDDCHIWGTSGVLSGGDVHLNVGMSAASTRLLIGLSALRVATTHIDGHPSMRARPNGYLLEALASLGAEVKSDNGHLPLSVRGNGSLGREVSLPGDQSSQYFSALLLAAPYFPSGLDIRVIGELVSKPYIDITLAEMAKFSVEVENDSYQRFRVGPQVYRAANVLVEGDASAASYFMGLATLSCGEVRFENLGGSSVQGDRDFAKVCEALGAHVQMDETTLTVTGPQGELTGLKEPLDMESMPDVAPTLMAMAPLLPARTKLVGLGTLRVKECDRLGGSARELTKLGVSVREGEDWIEIDPLSRDSFSRGVSIETYDDHRMAMSFAVLASMVGGIEIQDARCVDKTYPNFWRDLEAMGT